MSIIKSCTIFTALLTGLAVTAQSYSPSYKKLEVYGMDWHGHYIVSPKPGHVMMREHKKLTIQNSGKVKTIFKLIKEACKDTAGFTNLSYYCGFSFISKSDTNTFFIASKMESEKIYVRNKGSFFTANQKAISAILKLFPKKQIPKIAVSLPLDRSIYDLYSQKKWN